MSHRECQGRVAPVRPPRGLFRTLLPAILVLVAATATQGQVVIEGTVTDGAGHPVAEVDLDLFDAATGLKVLPYPPGMEGQDDNTDFSGHYYLVILPDVYRIRFSPPIGRPDLAPMRTAEVLAGSDQVIDVVLPAGVVLHGAVRDPDGAPVPSVDLDLIDSATGERAETVRDDTRFDGNYSFTVVPGVYDVVFEPPVGFGVAPLRVTRFDVTREATLDVTLPRGYVVSGVVKDQAGTGLANIDLDVDERATGSRIPTPGDLTAFDGSFQITLPAGTFDLTAVPLPGLALAPAAIHRLTVDADMTLPDIVMETGFAVTGTIRDGSGAPLPAADIDVFLSGTEDGYPGTAADGAGDFAFRMAAGDYDLLVSVDDSPLAPEWFRGVHVAADTTLDLQFSAAGPQLVSIANVIRDEEGRPVAGALVSGTPQGEGEEEPWSAITAADGGWTLWVRPGMYRLAVDPPLGSRLLPWSLEAVELPAGLPPEIRLERMPPPAALRLAIGPNPPPSGDRATTITLELPDADDAVLLDLFDLRGRRVAVLHQGPLSGGTTEFEWRGRSDAGERMSPGVYFLRLDSAAGRITRKVLRIR